MKKKKFENLRNKMGNFRANPFLLLNDVHSDWHCPSDQFEFVRRSSADQRWLHCLRDQTSIDERRFRLDHRRKCSQAQTFSSVDHSSPNSFAFSSYSSACFAQTSAEEQRNNDKQIIELLETIFIA